MPRGRSSVICIDDDSTVRYVRAMQAPPVSLGENRRRRAGGYGIVLLARPAA